MNRFLELTTKQRVADVLENAAECCTAPSNVSIIELHDKKSRVHHDLSQEELKTYFKERQDDGESAPSLRIWFINGTKSDSRYHLHLNPQMIRLIHELDKLTSDFLVNLYDTYDWTILPTQSSTALREGPSVLQYGFWEWADNATHAFNQRISNLKTNSYFCVNFSNDLQDKILNMIKQSPELAVSPLFIDLLIIDHVLRSYRQAVSVERSKLQAIEQGIGESSIKERVEDLHRLAIIWHIIVKDLTDIQQHIDSFTTLVDSDETPSKSETLEALRNLKSTCQFWFQWASTYLERTQIRINLMHNLAGQEDNRLNQSISKQAETIAKQTYQDGVWMSTLTVVTAVFLPGSFVSSLLGMNVFNYDGTVFAVSSLWWIFPVVTIILTSAVAIIWFLSSRYRARIELGRLNGHKSDSGNVAMKDIDPERGQEIRLQ